jgi:hypothetical protein
MKPYHKNPRQITKQQFENLERTLEELGDLSGIVHDLNSNEVIGGNQRARVFEILRNENAPIVITDTFVPPTKQGTIALGYIEWRGERYSYRQVRWTPRQCEKGNIVSNYGGGDTDYDILANEFEVGDLLTWGFDEAELGMAGFDLLGDEHDNYSRKIEAPTYEPTNAKPGLDSLFDKTRTQTLIDEIDKANGISEDEKAFLRIAAQRHTVLSFEKIADYYAHSGAEMQRLMEDSALVIIDFDKAISLGFVKLSEKIAEMVRDEYGDE